MPHTLHTKKQRVRGVKTTNDMPDRVLTAADLAHSIQTPLAILKGELFFLRQEIPENIRATLCDSLIDSIASSLSAFLQVSKLEHALRRDSMADFCLSELCEETIGHLDILAQAHGATIQAKIEPELTLHGLPDKIRELLINIIGNSIKYIGAGPKRSIYVLLLKNKTGLHLIVEDTGIGIAKETLKKLYTPFYRGKHESSNEIQGTGLGLAIVKKIADAHNASIHTTSTLGHGTRTEVIFPFD